MNVLSIAQIANWIGIGSVILILIGLLIQWLTKPPKNNLIKDSEALEQALKNWETIVVGAENIETHRDVKTFANLARVICALHEKRFEKETKNMVPVLVGLTALVTIEELGMSKESYNKLKSKNYEFQNSNLKNSINVNWKNDILSKIKELEEQLDCDSWKQFLEIAKFVEFPETSSKS